MCEVSRLRITYICYNRVYPGLPVQNSATPHFGVPPQKRVHSVPGLAEHWTGVCSAGVYCKVRDPIPHHSPQLLKGSHNLRKGTNCWHFCSEISANFTG